jgi:SAM-dependent methyltransferase
MFDDVTRTLREGYDRKANDRERFTPPAWETRERDAFLRLVRQEEKHLLLELGAATGFDAAAFSTQGLDVVCVDLSPEMVRQCRHRGLVAHVMDVTELRFPPSSFDAVYARNCLVHVPATQLPDALAEIDRVLRPGGLAYIGQYGGREIEGVWEDDHYEPKRFFSHRTDDQLLHAVTSLFALHSFARVPHGWRGLHFQSMVLRKRSA